MLTRSNGITRVVAASSLRMNSGTADGIVRPHARLHVADGAGRRGLGWFGRPQGWWDGRFANPTQGGVQPPGSLPMCRWRRSPAAEALPPDGREVATQRQAVTAAQASYKIGDAFERATSPRL